MVTLELDGRITFRITIPDAQGVEIVGAFSSWEEQRYPMTLDSDGSWHACIDTRPGEHLFRYLIDNDTWALDLQAHGVCTSNDGIQKSRVWRPPLSLGPDSIAA